MSRSVQTRSIAARQKIIDGALQVLAQAGVPGLTHRAVAAAAGVSLAATTYHYATKKDILDAASQHLLNGYISAFDRLAARPDPGIGSVQDLVRRVTLTALGRERQRSLAWCEIVLHGGRSAEGQAIVEAWYHALDRVWQGMADRTGDGVPVAAAIDRAVGATFLLHPLQLAPERAAALLDGQLVLADAQAPTSTAAVATGPRARVLQAALDVLAQDGAAALTHKAVAERAGMVRSGPSYHFPALDDLRTAAQELLATRARTRYQEGFAATNGRALDGDLALDLTCVVFLREVLAFPGENLGNFSAWIEAARAPAPVPSLQDQIADYLRGWRRLVLALQPAHPAPERAGFALQAEFVGRMIRVLATGRQTADLVTTRAAFGVSFATA